MSRLLLVDSTNELHRAWHAMRASPLARASAAAPVDPEGLDVSLDAVAGWARMLVPLLEERPDAVVACFDDRESWRRGAFPAYKAGSSTTDDLRRQYPAAEALAQALGVHTLHVTGYEADDLMATAARRWRSRFDEIVLLTPDKDVGQCLLGDRVVQFDRQRKVRTTETSFQLRWGIKPYLLPDWLALVGDPSDGIPGIPRWGQKAASALIARYGSIEEILIADPPANEMVEIVRGGGSLMRNLKERQRDAMLYRTLATLSTDVDESLDGAPQFRAIEYDFAYRGARFEQIDPMLRNLGEARLLERLILRG